MKPRVLVVEDEETLGSMLADLLSGEGFEAEVATNGEDAMQRLEHGSYALVLLDLMLPLREGDEVLGWLSEQPGRGEKVVVMTSAPRERVEGKAYHEFLAKPFRFDDLLRVAGKVRP